MWLLREGHAWLLGGCVVAWGVCMVAPEGACVVALGGHMWFLPGGMHGFCWGACMVFGRGWGACVAFARGRAWFLLGGHAWFLLGVCMVFLGGVHGFPWGRE